MDVGLNNRNTLGELEPAFKDVVFMVEATSSEQQTLWEGYSTDSMSNIKPLSDEVMACLSEAVKAWPVLLRVTELNDAVKSFEAKRYKWEQISAGFAITIGHVTIARKKLPVTVSFNFAMIEGKKVCFYYCCSRTADHTMVEDWLIKRFQLTHDGYTRWNHTDAPNFHNCVNRLGNLDKKPRNTKYKGK